jgi:hypothetical protein
MQLFMNFNIKKQLKASTLFAEKDFRREGKCFFSSAITQAKALDLIINYYGLFYLLLIDRESL